VFCCERLISSLRDCIFIFLSFPVMASNKKERKASVWLKAQRILRDSLKVLLLLSDNFAGGVDNSSSGIVPVFLMPEAGQKGVGIAG
jgi:hypothetical protein